MAKVDITQEMIDLVVTHKDKKDDEILGLIIGSGVPFSAAKAVLNTILVEQGLRITKDQRDEMAAEILAGFEVSAATTPDDIAEQIQLVSAECDCSAKIARTYIKALFDEADIEMPKAATGGGVRGPREPGFGGDAAITTDFLLENPDCTEESFREYMVSIGKDKTVKGADKVSGWWGFIADMKVFLAKWENK